MTKSRSEDGIDPAWWTAILIAVLVAAVFFSWAMFSGVFRHYLRVTLVSDRAGLVMEPGSKVKMRGVVIGRVADVAGGNGQVQLALALNPNEVANIPANVDAKIAATTAFGAKYVELIVPPDPSPHSIAAGAVLHSRNVSTEINTVFESLVATLKQIDPGELNATLTALADGLRGRGDAIGRAVTGANEVLEALNPRMDTVRQDFRSVQGFSDAYSAAAADLVTILDAASTTSTTITANATALDALLVNVIGLTNSGVNLLEPNSRTLVHAVNVLEPTTNLLLQYNPEYTCLLMGAKWFLDSGGVSEAGGNGYSAVVDSSILFGADIYKYPDNLPVVNARGGPGGKPG